jgi:glycosyltransferase involved in cell wall biosynthesis
MRIIVVGTLIEVKGHQYLIEACGQLARRGLRVSLDIVGEGKLRKKLQQQTMNLGLQDSVRFHGGLPRQQVVELFQAADVSALTSVQTRNGKREGIPVVLMEAMASGLPVVASRISGIPELVEDGTTGFLAPPRDSVAIAAALEKLARDPALRQSMGRAGRDRVVREFNLEQNACILLDRIHLTHMSRKLDKPRAALACTPASR